MVFFEHTFWITSRKGCLKTKNLDKTIVVPQESGVFEKSSPNVLIGNREHNIYAEIDVFLENGDCALAVEVKTQANIGDIREYVERMEKLRRYFDLRHDARKLYGAVAAAIVPDNICDFSLKQGFYVIEQSGDSVTITKPGDSPKA
jgi:hypothetical protein